MDWDRHYREHRQAWGGQPGELALITADYLKQHLTDYDELRIVDVGCGYGRDALYLYGQLGCGVEGIDLSPEAIGMARSLAKDTGGGVSFTCGNFVELPDSQVDILYAGNLYQVLMQPERELFQRKVKSLLRPGGLLLLNALSINDPEEYGQGEPVPGEPDSFMGQKYLHFCSEQELRVAFCCLKIRELYEHSYIEPHAGGRDHHHTSWILIGEK